MTMKRSGSLMMMLCVIATTVVFNGYVAADISQEKPSYIYESAISDSARLKEGSRSAKIERPNDPLYYGESSDSFIIRWAFQDCCDYVYDPRIDIWRWPTDKKNGVTFNPAAVQPGDVIFVRCADQFFAEMHPLISNPYIIVSHGECLDAMQKRFLTYLDDEKVIAWFGIHAYEEPHPKFIPIPIGLMQEPEHYKKRKQMDAYCKELRATSVKEHLVYMNFAIQEDKPERKKVRKLFLDKPYCKRGTRQPFKTYLKEMASCTFAFSPPGLGCDCYRTWEALLVGCIPIVRSSQLDALYEDLPVLVIDRWENINEDFLKREHERITSKKYDIRKLYMEYWIEKIHAVKDRFLSGREKASHT